MEINNENNSNNNVYYNSEVKWSSITTSIMGLYLAFSFAAEILFEIIEKIFFFNNINLMILKSIIAIPIQLLINFFIWKKIMTMTLKNKSIKREKIKNVMIILTIFLVLHLGGNLFQKQLFIHNKVRKEILNMKISNISIESRLADYNYYKEKYGITINELDNYQQIKEKYSEYLKIQYGTYLLFFIIYLPIIDIIMLIYIYIYLRKNSKKNS